MTVLDRYHNNLKNPRAPGTGCHPWIMSTADYGVMAGLDGDRIFSDIRQAVPMGARHVHDKEIIDAINKALAELRGGTYKPRPRPKPVVQDGKSALQRIIDQGRYSDEADLWEASPIRLWEAP